MWMDVQVIRPWISYLASQILICVMWMIAFTLLRWLNGLSEIIYLNCLEQLAYMQTIYFLVIII